MYFWFFSVPLFLLGELEVEGADCIFYHRKSVSSAFISGKILPLRPLR